MCAYLGGRGIVCKLISLKKREGGLWLKVKEKVGEKRIKERKSERERELQEILKDLKENGNSGFYAKLTWNSFYISILEFNCFQYQNWNNHKIRIKTLDIQ